MSVEAQFPVLHIKLLSAMRLWSPCIKIKRAHDNPPASVGQYVMGYIGNW